MDFKNYLSKISAIVTEWLKFAGWLAWSFIMGIATVITFLIIFVLLLAILPDPLVWLISIISLLWFVYTYRHKITTVIAILIACALALALLGSMKYYLLPEWMITKMSTNFSFHSFGMTKIKNKTVDTLTAYGSVDLEDVLIEGPLTIYGRLDASSTKVQGRVAVYGRTELEDIDLKDDLTVYGKLNLDRGVVSGETKVYGAIRIEDSKLNDLVAYSRNITLKDSVAKNIFVYKKEHGKAIVTLVASKIEGDIVFDSGQGTVILEHGSSIAGKVVDGDIEIKQ